MADLKQPWQMHLNGGLFLLLLLMSAWLILIQIPSWLNAALLLLVIWTSARFYYYLFYVIQKYIDPSIRFAGVFDAIKYLLGRNRG
ncbi:MAG: hypothetical protein CO186_10800 [Zetaproteobacteria bacterium CG_4_9_14_3_um_filter_49_83]|nr:MAG: hypothetical protein AUJ56_09190 [Zetaproteobacteria bacterium CG1_02_49_23]PIQ33348.1 MAG: hypothetical protein COW62_05735 [Zetaproteobacteria bacterium CG17_big_fil_post_rev_8_21_14_2_50_50_13]PIV31071.1 MAG: hypothetical protein COS35_03365 [Zetaproteobacteria bacterium CG02_land_8_20_14_3_00_50_9]PIY57084.1 MAG: hypothetical protein COZ00_00915 [Zetaproteobacteria bacterium CG_4_10_14_0_8_um_filter_49_80]PJA34413.1 MAG: hypothetical protein CO186_10800 [Zetaproteobacteria bacterium